MRNVSFNPAFKRFHANITMLYEIQIEIAEYADSLPDRVDPIEQEPNVEERPGTYI